MLKLKLQYFGHLIRRTDSLEKTLMLGKIEGRRRRGWQRMRWLDGITNSMDMNLENSRRQWGTESPGVLQSMGLQRVRHDLAAEQRWHTTLSKPPGHFPGCALGVQCSLWACLTENSSQPLYLRSISPLLWSLLWLCRVIFFFLSFLPTALKTGFHYDNCCTDRTVYLMSVSTLECAGRGGLLLLGLP